MNKSTIAEFMQKEFSGTVSKQEWKRFSNVPCSVNTIVRLFGSWNNAIKEAGLIPFRRKLRPISQCPICGKDTKRKYCSRSCANRHRPRRRPTGQCAVCDKLIPKSKKYCSAKCRESQITSVSDMTKGQVAYGAKSWANRYSRINEHARLVYRKLDSKCERCGYSKHVEICHIRPIRGFSESALISEINSASNIKILCRNCHWEFDHG